MTAPSTDHHNVLEDLRKRFGKNIDRCYGLLQMFESQNIEEDPDEQEVDVLRAVVVFTHASLEDLLRTILGHFYRKNHKRIIDEFVQDKSKKNGLLERLKSAPLKSTVEEFAESLIEEKLQYTSFSDTNQIGSMLMKVQIEISALDLYMNSISALIRRRHQIVHNADLDTRQEPAGVNPLDFNTVNDWLSKARAFGEEVIGALDLEIG